MRRVLVGALLAVAGWAPAAGARASQDVRPTFRSSTDLVAVSAVVRKTNGQPVINLTAKDFELVDTGQPRRITDFRNEPAPVTIALLADTSGSMNVAARLEAARAATGHILAWLTPGSDQVGLFTFDTALHEVEHVGPSPGTIMKSLEGVKPFGSTSLFDAIAGTGRRLAALGSTRRAVVAITDGGDNASRLSAGDVSGIASEIDVPVYIVVVISPFDHAAATTAEDRASYEQYASGRLGDLARWTGGALFVAATPAQASAMARQIVSELRQQYLIAFEPDAKPGWHPIELKTRQSDLIVRARSGYVVRYTPELR